MAGFSYPTGACACSREKCSYECETYSRWNPKPATNADRIRAMSDEDLATWIETIADCHLCPMLDEQCSGGGENSRASCKHHWLEWLRQEAGGGD